MAQSLCRHDLCVVGRFVWQRTTHAVASDNITLDNSLVPMYRMIGLMELAYLMASGTYGVNAPCASHQRNSGQGD